MKIKRQIIFLLILIISIQSIFASEESTFILGGKTGWNSVIDRRNVTTTSGRYGLQALKIADTGGIITNETDLFFDFETSSAIDLTGNYEVLFDTSIKSTNNPIRGKSFAYFDEVSDGMKISGLENSMLGSTGITGSFTIGFWLNPYIADNGEIILFWDSSRDLANYTIYQMLYAEIQNSVVMWNFSNIFDFAKDKMELEDLVDSNKDIILKGRSTLIPKKWAYHQVSFDEITGLLEYTVNGVVEDLCYVTTTGEEWGEVCLPNLGLPTNLDIAPSFFGGMDDFTLTKATVSEPDYLEKYVSTGGRFVTPQLCLDECGATVKSVDLVDTVPSQTLVEYFIRSAEDCYNWTEDFPEWKPFNKNEELNIDGTFFQIAADLYPDGSGALSPSVTEIKINYSAEELPIPPYRLEAIPGNECVTLKWKNSNGTGNGEIFGYNIYYGEKPGEYLGVTAINGSSPIKVFTSDCTYTINGLKNGQIYYFAVSAFSQKNPKLEGTLSSEVYARPSSRL